MQLYLIFKPIYKTIMTLSGLFNTIPEWESMGLLFLGLVTDITNASNHTKCVSISNQKYQ